MIEQAGRIGVVSVVDDLSLTVESRDEPPESIVTEILSRHSDEIVREDGLPVVVVASLPRVSLIALIEEVRDASDDDVGAIS